MAEKEFVRDPKQDAREFANDFPEAASAVAGMVEGRAAPTGGPRSAEERQLLNDVNEVHRVMAQLGPRPASVINLHPFPLKPQGIHNQDIQVPACPLGVAYKQYVIESYAMDIADRGGRFTPRPVTAIDRAKDVLLQNDAHRRGGVVIYMGDHAPNKKNLDDIEAARAAMVENYRRLYEEGETEWHRTDKSGRRNISDAMRWAAAYLLHYRLIQKAPEWLTRVREAADVAARCPMCKAEPEKDAVICVKCNYIFKPDVAFELGEITAEHNSLRRLSREKLDELGLTSVVSITDRATKKKK